jgi:hypothetical protein
LLLKLVSLVTKAAAAARFVDLLLTLAAILVAAPSLFYPVSWDTSVHYYVAREWLLRGAIPYKDTFDHKTPGLYAMHAVAIAIFGDNVWGFRSLEIASVVALGVATAWLAARPGREPKPGMRGLGALVAVLFSFGCLNYWNLGQGELTCALFVTLSALAARRARRGRLGIFLSGALGGAALLMKPTALPFLCVSFWLCLRRERRWGRVTTCFVLGALLLPCVTAAYLAVHGALRASLDILVGANLDYVLHEPAIHKVADVGRASLKGFRYFAPLSYIVVALCAAALPATRWLRRDAHAFQNHVVASLFLLLAFLTVLVQAKFFPYHWSLATGGAALAVVSFAELAAGRIRAPVLRLLVAPALAACAVLAFTRAREPFAAWRTNCALTAGWLDGRVSDQTFARAPERAPIDPLNWQPKEVGEWIRLHSSPEDRILVRGASAEVYNVSGRRAPGRFFWSVFLSTPTRPYRREQWSSEDLAAIREHPPRYVIVREGAKPGIESADAFAPLGYSEQHRIGVWRILAQVRERSPTEARLAEAPGAKTR